MKAEQINYQNNFSFSANTTYGLGGFADRAYFPQSVKEAEELFEYLIKDKEKFVVLGNGSNVLASDRGFKGVVISTKKLKGISYAQGELYCGSGVTVSELLKFCKINGLSNLEFLAGIPASVGGAAFMNASAAGKSVSDYIEFVTIFDGKERILSKNECVYSNKHSTMRDIICLILGVKFKVTTRCSKDIEDNIQMYLKLRANQPKGKSCGCVFKNPDAISAGMLIEKAGLKGLKVGGAEVSKTHANFIINNGGSADDVYKLICIIKKMVYSVFGIELFEEVVYIGDFNGTDS